MRGKWGVAVQWVKRFNYTRGISSRNLLYSIAPIVNNTVFLKVYLRLNVLNYNKWPRIQRNTIATIKCSHMVLMALQPSHLTPTPNSSTGSNAVTGFFVFMDPVFPGKGNGTRSHWVILSPCHQEHLFSDCRYQPYLQGSTEWVWATTLTLHKGEG